MHEGKKVSVVMPAYNEEKGIAGVVGGFIRLGLVDEVIVVDNNSSDATAAIALRSGARIVKEPKQGYGHACLRALLSAQGDYIVLVESDATFSPKDIFKFLAYLDDFDFVQGTRTTKELIGQSANMYFFLKWGNWLVAKIMQVVYNGPALTDMGCTYRAMTKEVLEKIKGDLYIGGSAFLANMTVAVLKRRIRMIEIPVNYRKREGLSKITGSFARAVRVGLTMLGIIITHIFKRYK